MANTSRTHVRTHTHTHTHTLARQLVRGCTVSRYEQLETSPETIEQELLFAVCEHRQTDRQTDRQTNLRRIIV